MTDAPSLVDQVCDDVRGRDGDVEQLVDEAVRQRAPLLAGDARADLRRRSLARMTGLGELDDFVHDPTVDEVLVNDHAIWIDRRGRLTPVGQLDASTTFDLIERILAPIGRRVDRSSPIVDARLASGARVSAVLPPIAVDAHNDEGEGNDNNRAASALGWRNSSDRAGAGSGFC